MILQKETRRLIRRNFWGAAIASAALMISVPVCALAEGETGANENVRVDEITGEPYKDVDPNADPVQEEKKQIYIDQYCVYDIPSEEYLFSASDMGGELLRSNIGDGTITNGAVNLYIYSYVKCMVYRDGIELTDAALENITEPGSYIVRVEGENGRILTVLRFSIVPEFTNVLGLSSNGIYNIDYYTVGDRTCEASDGFINMTEEGEYTISLTNKYIEENIVVSTTVIHTPPALKLEALDEKNFARGPVSIADADPNWELVIFRNNEKITAQDGELADAGNYTITIYDQAGNITNYSFTILIYLNDVGMIFVLLIILLTIGLIVYLIIARKKMKVR